MIRVKICGLTRLEDVEDAVLAGADAIGFQFVDASPRRISVEQAVQLRKAIPPFVSVVGVFVNADRETIKLIAEVVGLDYAQLHGDETPEFLQTLPVRSIKTIGVSSADDLANLDRFPAQAILLDSKVEGRVGGTGRCFDWSFLKDLRTTHSIILAGGLRSDNVAQAIELAKPNSVDVCTGVESGLGIKNYQKMQEFIKVVRSIDAALSDSQQFAFRT